MLEVQQQKTLHSTDVTGTFKAFILFHPSWVFNCDVCTVQAGHAMQNSSSHLCIKGKIW